MMWRIMIVDDQAIVRQGLTMMLEQDDHIQVVCEAENGKEAIRLLEEGTIVDLVLMDVRMPEMNGIEATRIMKEKWADIKIIILTTFNDEQYALETLKDGANGFLLKTAEADELIKAVHSTMRDGLSIHEDVAAKVIPSLLKHEKAKQLPAHLTTREIDILTLIGKGKSNKEIAESLHLSVGTIKNNVTIILQKLHLRNRTQLAIYAVKNNIM